MANSGVGSPQADAECYVTWEEDWPVCWYCTSYLYAQEKAFADEAHQVAKVRAKVRHRRPFCAQRASGNHGAAIHVSAVVPTSRRLFFDF